MDTTRVRVNTPDVMHETIDGEVIIINLSSGNYYSVRGSGADVWTLIGATPGASDDALASALAARYDCSPAEIKSSLQDFLAQLHVEGLVAEVADPDAGAAAVGLELTASGPAEPFTAPRLEKYTDLQDLVLLDPVHQVDQAGWPAPAPEGAR